MSFKIINTVFIASVVVLGFAMLVNSQDATLTDICFRCICEAVSGCNTTQGCTKGNDICGLFRISWAYWTDAGQLTLPGESPLSNNAFKNCANDPLCAYNTVYNYMQIFAQDCNGDRQIDCHDYAAIHTLGGYGCKGEVDESYLNKLNQCLDDLLPSRK